MKVVKSILVIAAACLTPMISHATPITLNPTLSVGGLDFEGFTCSISSGGAYASPSSCSQININKITSPGNGIQITSGFTAFPSSFDDAVIDYHVSSTSSGTGIDSVGLDFNGNFFGHAVSSVTESVFSGSQLVGFAIVSCGADVGCSRTDTITLDGTYTNLYVEKDIDVSAALGLAGISIIDQTFGTDPVAPEPSSMALLGSGLIGAALFFRRRNKLAAARKDQIPA